VGPRDLVEGNVTVVTRHRLHKENMALAQVRSGVATTLAGVASELMAEALALREGRTSDVDSIEEAIEVATSGFARVSLKALGPDGEERLATQALTIRCLQRPDGALAEPEDDDVDLVAVVGRSY
jgi:prolyl-tRNA synthetase